MSGFRRFLHFLRPPPLIPTTIRTVQLLAAIHFFTTSIGELRICSGFSMLPTMAHNGVWVIVSPLPYYNLFGKLTNKPSRGDLIFASKPSNPGETICKRVIAVEGDVVEVEVRRGEQRKWVGREIDEVKPPSPSLNHRKGEGKWVKIPKGCVWLAGDNMSNSTDSRDYGPLPLAMIKGKVLAQVWPGFRWFENPTRHIDGPPMLN